MPSSACKTQRRWQCAAIGELLPNVGGYRRPGAFKAEPALQFIGQQGEVERLAMWQDVGQKLTCWSWPIWLVIPAGSFGDKSFLVDQPLVTQLIKPAGLDHQPFGRRAGIQQASIEGAENFLNEQR